VIREPVNSSLIKSVGYADGEMHIEFNSGKVFAYTGPKVPEHYQQMMAADSIGKYFGAHVRRCPETVCRPVETAPA
jgi:hypothetical protein